MAIGEGRRDFDFPPYYRKARNNLVIKRFFIRNKEKQIKRGFIFSKNFKNF
jgi:hypothetical protein